MRNKGGISIAEVIVIIFVLLFLFGVFYPYITRDHEQSKHVICLSHLKQWGLAYVMFCDDNNQKFIDISDYSNQSKWLTELKPYNRFMDETLKCPYARTSRFNGEEYGGPNNSYKVTLDKNDSNNISIESSYGINSWVYNPELDSNIIAIYPAEIFWKNNAYKNASKLPVIADSIWAGSFPEPDGIAGKPPIENGEWSETELGMKNFCIDRHKHAINISFMDGSVSKVGLKDLWKLKWHKNFDTEGPWTKPDAAWPEWMKTLK